MLIRFFGYILIGAVLVTAAVVVYTSSGQSTNQLIFSPIQVLAASWYNYKKLYIEPSTFRTIDKGRGGVTTSEGQSYTMLRAVWQGDQETFDGAWEWTASNLGRQADHLFSWLWGMRANGTTGILTDQGGQNSASDADTDIALALILAYARWQDPQYLTEARLIIADIWDKEVVMINGAPYLAANDIEKKSKSPAIVVNPSYFNPAAYYLFSLVDTGHAWEKLRTQSYVVLRESSRIPLDAPSSSFLPPNWILVDRKSGKITAFTAPNHDTNFGFDALRIPLRVALDAEWFHNPDAEEALRDFAFLSSAWKNSGRLASTYAHDGSVVDPHESPAMYGGVMGYFLFVDPEAATAIYQEKLVSLYDQDIGTWSTPLSYYEENLAWFGIALYNRKLPNLAAGLPDTAFTES